MSLFTTMDKNVQLECGQIDCQWKQKTGFLERRYLFRDITSSIYIKEVLATFSCSVTLTFGENIHNSSCKQEKIYESCENESYFLKHKICVEHVKNLDRNSLYEKGLFLKDIC